MLHYTIIIYNMIYYTIITISVDTMLYYTILYLYYTTLHHTIRYDTEPCGNVFSLIKAYFFTENMFPPTEITRLMKLLLRISCFP